MYDKGIYNTIDGFGESINGNSRSRLCSDLEMDSQEFYQLVDEMSIFGDTLGVNCTEKQVKFTGKGNLGEMTAIIKEDDILMYAVEEDADLTVNIE